MSRRCPSNPEYACPWLISLDASIGIAKDEAEHKVFFGKKKANQHVEELIGERAQAQEYIAQNDCPLPELSDDGQIMSCGLLVVNNALQGIDAELIELINTTEEQ